MDEELADVVARFAGALGPDGDMRVEDWAFDFSGLNDAARVAAQGLVDAGQHMAARAVAVWALGNGRTQAPRKKRTSDELDELLADIGADEPDAKRPRTKLEDGERAELDLDIEEMLDELNTGAGGAADDGGYNSPTPPHTFYDCSGHTSEETALHLLARDANTGTEFQVKVYATKKYDNGSIKYQVNFGGKWYGWVKARIKTEVCFGISTQYIEANAGKHPVGRIYAFHIVGPAIPPPFE
jgi:hypothetical protein